MNKTTIAPSNKYPTIQDAINAANSGDTIMILPGSYNETLSIINKDNLSLIASNLNGQSTNNYQVTFSGTGKGDTGLTIEANNIYVEGLIFKFFENGVSLEGSNNTLSQVVTFLCSRGINTSGNYNKFISCIDQENSIVGINAKGDYNQFITCRVNNNKRGIISTNGSFVGNIFYKNLINNNEQANIRISSTSADKSVFILNTISDSIYGVLCTIGRISFISNTLINHTNAGLIYKDNYGYILDNNFFNNEIGLNLYTSSSKLAGNVVQQGKNTGIILNGTKNHILSNTVTSYENTGLIVNGCKNTLCNNNLLCNKIDLICDEYKNTMDSNCTYCPNACCVDSDDLSKCLNIFN